MSSISSIMSRTTMLMSSNQLQGQLRETQRMLLEAQNQISTGKRYNSPSDAPDRTAAMLFLQQRLGERNQHNGNLQHTETMLNNVDSALGEANELLRDAKSLTLSQIGVGADSESRANAATDIDAKLQALMDLANRQFNNVSLFGGRAGAGADGNVFESFLGGVRYLGSEDNLTGDTGLSNSPAMTATGNDAFGALSARIVSEVDLDPQASADTRITDIEGAQGEGVRLGTIQLDVNGTTANVDLTGVDKLGDVTTRINDAINTIDPTAGALAINGPGFELTANAGHTVTLADIGSGQTAADLGIDISATGATTAGGDLNRLLDPLTQLADLGAAIDFASGLTITQGDKTKTADFSTAQTIEDLQNEIDQLDLGLRLQINKDRTGLNLVSEVSGIELSVGENGGTTAQDLGLRNFGVNTSLSDLRHGLGVETVEGENDLEFALHDGTSFAVNLDGAQTVGDVINSIQAAATGAGLTVGAGNDLEIGLAANGNGFVFTDNTAGGDDFRIDNAGTSHAADHLGIHRNAGGDATITGADKATVKVDSVFTHLIDLRDSLRNDNELGITLAGDKLDTDLERLANTQAQVGIEGRRVRDEQSRSQEQQVAEESMLSEIQDADLSEVITRFMQLQAQLQASLQSGAQNMQLNLLNFLR
ncbi:MAG: flagellin [Phycisphaeraceae bacterium]